MRFAGTRAFNACVAIQYPRPNPAGILMGFFVYKLTFANGKIYIGMSRTERHGHSVSRYQEHDYAARSGVDLPVYKAWRKHGAPTEEIISHHASKNECAQAEIAAIAHHCSRDRAVGYNVTIGGDGLHVENGSPTYLKIGSKTWNNPEWRANMSDRFSGRGDVRSSEGKERQRAAMAKHARTGHASKMRAASFSNPETVRKFEAGRAKWRESARNRDNCRRIAKLSALACSQRVMDSKSGIQYSSQRAMAVALGVSDATISRRVARGTCVRL